MGSKNTQFAFRIPKILKEKFEKACSEEDATPSEVARELMRHYSLGIPSMRRVLEENTKRLDAMIALLKQMEVKE